MRRSTRCGRKLHRGNAMKGVFSKVQIVLGVVVGTVVALDVLRFVELNWPLYLVELFLLTVWLFDGAMHAYSRWLNDDLHWFLAWCWAPGVVVVGALDVWFNLFVGTVHFGEAPRFREKEILFTNRVQRHIDMAYSCEDYRKAKFWMGVLNNIDKGHIQPRDVEPF